jgi:hypothetical protein
MKTRLLSRSARSLLAAFAVTCALLVVPAASSAMPIRDYTDTSTQSVSSDSTSTQPVIRTVKEGAGPLAVILASAALAAALGSAGYARLAIRHTRS